MNEIKLNEVTSLLQELKASKINGYGASRIPNEIDDKIINTVNSYLKLNERERKNIRELIGHDHKFTFLAFAERSASLAIRKKSREQLILAMIAMFLQKGVGDVREDITILTLIHAAAQKLKIDPYSIFMDSAQQFGLPKLSGLNSFLRRSEEDKSIDSMGYVEGEDNDGFRFIRTW